jgi:hypothetical protein
MQPGAKNEGILAPKNRHPRRSRRRDPALLANSCSHVNSGRQMRPIVYRGEPTPQPIVPGGAVCLPVETGRDDKALPPPPSLPRFSFQSPSATSDKSDDSGPARRPFLISVHM